MTKRWSLRVLVGVFSFLTCFIAAGYAEKLTIVVTGNAHGELYTAEGQLNRPTGGVASRNALIKDIRAAEKNSIVVDTGEGFMPSAPTAVPGGDQQYDMRMSKLYAQSLKIGGYDASALSDAELRFGPEFLVAVQNDVKVPYLSCNVMLPGIPAYVIKSAGNLKVGIIGVSPQGLGNKYRLEEKPFTEAVRASVQEVKKIGALVVILLSNLTDAQNQQLVKDIPGIDVVAGGTGQRGQNYYVKIGNSYAVYPFPFGQKVIRVDMRIAQQAVQSVSFNQSSIQQDSKEDPMTKKILPACVSDEHCPKKEGWVGRCTRGGEPAAQCLYAEAHPVKLTLITDTRQKVYSDDPLTQWLKKEIPGLKVEKMDYTAGKAKTLIRENTIQSLPAFMFDAAVEKEPLFAGKSNFFLKKKDGYLLEPAVSGVFLLLDRPKKENKIDVFINLSDSSASEVIDYLRDSKGSKQVSVHPLVVEKDGQFMALGGLSEVEESLRFIAVEKLYPPEKFWDYMHYRFQNIKSTWWDLSAKQAGIDPAKISDFAQSEEAKQLLRQKSTLSEELRIMQGPVILIDNNRIYALQKKVGKYQLKNILQN